MTEFRCLSVLDSCKEVCNACKRSQLNYHVKELEKKIRDCERDMRWLPHWRDVLSALKSDIEELK